MFLMLALAGTTAFGQVPPGEAFSAMRWRLVGPFRAGRAIAAAGIPGDPYTFYFGGVDGGMWKTSNAGVTWEPISDGQMNPSIGALAISASDPRVMYVGTGEADIRSDITYGDGMYTSTDGGARWSHIGLTDTRHIGQVLIDPRDPGVVLVAALGHAYGPNTERGVFRTSDGGKTWTKVLYRNPDVGAIDVAWDPRDPSVVYAALWEARRTPWSQYPPNQGPGGGLWKSTDEGLTWSELACDGLPPKPYGRIGLAVVPGSHGDILYALVDTQKAGAGLYRSDDGGKNWELRSRDANITTRMWYFGGITIDPQHPDTIFIPNRSLMRSTDGGRTFTAIKGAPGGDDYHYLWVDPLESRRMIVASDQGTTVSVEGGQTWSSWYNQPTGQFYHGITDNQFPYRIYGAQQDMGTTSITSRSDYGEITYRNWYSVGAGESGYIAPDPLNPAIVYGGSSYGGAFRYDNMTGQSQVISPSLLGSFGTPAPQREYRFTWTSPLVFDRRDPHTLYLGAQVLLRTRDGGLHWQAISPDLTGADPLQRSKPGPPALQDAAARGWGVIYAVAPSPLRAGLIWVGTDDGFIHLTTDGGSHWKNITPSGLPPWSKVSIIEASPFDPGEAYAAVDRHRLDDLAPYIYRTRDYGLHWTRADDGISEGAFVQVVRSDLTRKGLLYAGTETGVFVSFDDGDHWQSLQLNLPLASVRDLAVHENDLVAATHGRAFWVLDDLTPLQQMDAHILSADAHLFRPETAIRIRRSENHDTPLPPEFPHGTNPPAGAIIDYELGRVPSSPITLEILDEDGNRVFSASSADQPQRPGGVVYFMNSWLPRFESLTAEQGHNRFVWNLRYPPPPTRQHDFSIAAIAGEGTVREPEGPLVLPGRYRVILTVNDRKYEQPLRVVMDPRVHVSGAALKNQLSLALSVWDASADENASGLAVDSLRRQLIRLRRSHGLDALTGTVLDSLLNSTARIRDSLNAETFSSLETSILSADREPTRQMHTAFRRLSERLASVRKDWEGAVGRDVEELDRRLMKAGIGPVRRVEPHADHLNVKAAGH